MGAHGAVRKADADRLAIDDLRSGEDREVRGQRVGHRREDRGLRPVVLRERVVRDGRRGILREPGLGCALGAGHDGDEAPVAREHRVHGRMTVPHDGHVDVRFAAGDPEPDVTVGVGEDRHAPASPRERDPEVLPLAARRGAPDALARRPCPSLAPRREEELHVVRIEAEVARLRWRPEETAFRIPHADEALAGPLVLDDREGDGPLAPVDAPGRPSEDARRQLEAAERLAPERHLLAAVAPGLGDRVLDITVERELRRGEPTDALGVEHARRLDDRGPEVVEDGAGAREGLAQTRCRDARDLRTDPDDLVLGVATHADLPPRVPATEVTAHRPELTSTCAGRTRTARPR